MTWRMKWRMKEVGKIHVNDTEPENIDIAQVSVVENEEEVIDVKIIRKSRHLLPAFIKAAAPKSKGKTHVELIHPDTGASKSVIGKDMLVKMKLSHLIEPSSRYRLFNASNRPMAISGTIKLLVKDQNEVDGDFSE